MKEIFLWYFYVCMSHYTNKLFGLIAKENVYEKNYENYIKNYFLMYDLQFQIHHGIIFSLTV